LKHSGLVLSHRRCRRRQVAHPFRSRETTFLFRGCRGGPCLAAADGRGSGGDAESDMAAVVKRRALEKRCYRRAEGKEWARVEGRKMTD